MAPSGDGNRLVDGGGGHQNAGTCQVAHEDAEQVLDEVAAAVNAVLAVA